MRRRRPNPAARLLFALTALALGAMFRRVSRRHPTPWRPSSAPHVGLAVATLCVAVAFPAAAQAPPGIPGGENFAPSLRSADEGTPKPYADDERTGHLYLRGSSALAAPAGSLSAGAALADVASVGGAFGGGVGFGISRHAELDLAASYALFGAAEGCEGCSASSFSASLGLSYHLAQGVAIDPWVRLGTGFRAADVQSDGARVRRFTASGSYLGLDVVQLAIGASFAPVAGVAVGPYLGVDIGSFLSRPELQLETGQELQTSGRTYALFHLGLRFELDPVRWVSQGPAPSPAVAHGWSPAAPPPQNSALQVGQVRSTVVSEPNPSL